MHGWRGIEEPIRADTSEGRTVYLVRNAAGSYIRISLGAYQLLRQRDQRVPFPDIARSLSDKLGSEVDPSDVERAYQGIVARINKAKPADPSFAFRQRLIPGRIVARLVAPLTGLFATGIVVPALAFSILAVFVAIAFASPDGISPNAGTIGYALTFAILLAHELGHASACARYGVQPSDIGATLYLIFPALYSDVTGAWELKRWQRVVVDLGGMYFQWIATGAVAVIYVFTAWHPLLVSLYFSLGSMAMSLNPILKFDGYWVVADALGVTNLRRQPTRVVKHMWARLRGKPTTPLPWTRTVTVLLIGYSTLTFWFTGFFLYFIGPRLWSMLQAYPSALLDLVRALANPSTLGLDAILGPLILTFFLFTMLRMLWWKVVMVGKLAARLVRRRPALARARVVTPPTTPRDANKRWSEPPPPRASA